jgi:hypothetical protein
MPSLWQRMNEMRASGMIGGDGLLRERVQLVLVEFHIIPLTVQLPPLAGPLVACPDHCN